MEQLQLAALMLDELRSNRLTVVKTPDYKRKAVECNARWYSDFCKSYERLRRRRWRKARTIIKRCHTIATLEKIIRGTANPSSVYTQRIMDLL